MIFNPFMYMINHADSTKDETSSTVAIAQSAATIATLETVAVVLVAVNLLRLGSSYHYADVQKMTLFQLTVAATTIFALFLTPRVLMYFGHFVGVAEIQYAPIIAYWAIDNILEFASHAFAFAFAFAPILPFLLKEKIDYHCTIDAHRVAEAIWYVS
jgi:hypothetical protein